MDPEYHAYSEIEKDILRNRLGGVLVNEIDQEQPLALSGMFLMRHENKPGVEIAADIQFPMIQGGVMLQPGEMYFTENGRVLFSTIGPGFREGRAPGHKSRLTEMCVLANWNAALAVLTAPGISPNPVNATLEIIPDGEDPAWMQAALMKIYERKIVEHIRPHIEHKMRSIQAQLDAAGVAADPEKMRNWEEFCSELFAWEFFGENMLHHQLSLEIDVSQFIAEGTQRKILEQAEERFVNAHKKNPAWNYTGNGIQYQVTYTDTTSKKPKKHTPRDRPSKPDLKHLWKGKP